MVTTIQLDEHTKALLDKLKKHHRESYNELLGRMIEVYKSGVGSDRESLVETLDIMSNPAEMRAIAESIEEYNSGKGKTLKQLRKELNT